MTHGSRPHEGNGSSRSRFWAGRAGGDRFVIAAGLLLLVAVVQARPGISVYAMTPTVTDVTAVYVTWTSPVPSL
jgi:hypothetical protein